GQGWNILGGYGGQYSFGQAAFFGTGAYATAILQVHYGVNAWIAFAAGIVAGATVGAVIGALTFRAGDARVRGSAAHPGQRRTHDRCGRRSPREARSTRAGVSVSEPDDLLSHHPGAGR